jgi:hypothetical protein
MAWGWATPVTGVLAAAAGLAGVLVGGALARRNERRMARDRFQHELRLADEIWKREQRGSTYTELLDIAEQFGYALGLASVVRPGQDPPELPSIDTQRRSWSRIRAFGSRAVRRRFESMTLTVRR